MGNRSRLLPSPRVEVCREGRVVRGVTVRLRTGKAQRALESDPEIFVSIAVDGHGLPLALHLEERREPLAMLRDLLDLVLRSTEGDPAERRRFASPEYVARLHRALRRAFRLLPDSPVLAAPRR